MSRKRDQLTEKQTDTEDQARYTLPRDEYHRIHRGDLLLRQLIGDLVDMRRYRPETWPAVLDLALRKVGPPYYMEDDVDG